MGELLLREAVWIRVHVPALMDHPTVPSVEVFGVLASGFMDARY
jgi:hypothetical protein